MKLSDRELEEVVSKYVDILNDQGPESVQERAYLDKYAKDPEILGLLRGARAVKSLFESFANFPEQTKAKRGSPRRKGKSV